MLEKCLISARRLVDGKEKPSTRTPFRNSMLAERCRTRQHPPLHLSGRLPMLTPPRRDAAATEPVRAHGRLPNAQTRPNNPNNPPDRTLRPASSRPAVSAGRAAPRAVARFRSADVHRAVRRLDERQRVRSNAAIGSPVLETSLPIEIGFECGYDMIVNLEHSSPAAAHLAASDSWQARANLAACVLGREHGAGSTE